MDIKHLVHKYYFKVQNIHIFVRLSEYHVYLICVLINLTDDCNITLSNHLPFNFCLIKSVT